MVDIYLIYLFSFQDGSSIWGITMDKIVHSCTMLYYPSFLFNNYGSVGITNAHPVDASPDFRWIFLPHRFVNRVREC
jgi:hypothetical protein